MLVKNKIIVYLCLVICLGACSTSKPVIVSGSSGNTSSLNDKTDIRIQKRMMVYQASLDLVVKVPDSLRQPLTDMAQKYGGYLVKFSPEYASISVEAKQLNQALATLESLGKVKNKRITGEDVTAFYQDTQIRLENAEKTRKRFLELLDKAQNVEEILKIEKELSRINEQIDLLKGKIKSMDQQVALSLIEIDIQKKVKLGPLGYLTYGLFKGVSWLFVRN